MDVHVNADANRICDEAVSDRERLRLSAHRLDSGTRVIDFGVKALGGLEAGLCLARICMGGAASVMLGPSDDSLWMGPQVLVSTDQPAVACMAAQYAGWPVQDEKYFAMGSGPMRTRRGREPVLETLEFSESQSLAVGVLETEELPSDRVAKAISEACRISPDQLTLCVAPTRSLAGTMQVVARSIETCLHKLFELKFDLRSIRSAYGAAPLPPPAKDFAKGIGRTNDAILYGGKVTLWFEGEDAEIESIGPQIPSRSSADWGEPFYKTFKKYQYDFYKVDPGLFSPAVISLINLRSGKCWKFGELRPDVLRESFER